MHFTNIRIGAGSVKSVTICPIAGTGISAIKRTIVCHNVVKTTFVLPLNLITNADRDFLRIEGVIVVGSDNKRIGKYLNCISQCQKNNH